MPFSITVIERETQPADLAMPARGIVRRGPAGATVSSTGHTMLNSAGTDALREAMRLNNYVNDSVALTAAIDEPSGLVLLYPVKPGEAGSVTCRFPSRRHVTLLHLHSIFAQYSHLRLTERTFCPILLAKDSKERYCIAVAIKGGYPADRRGRSSRSPETAPTGE